MARAGISFWWDNATDGPHLGSRVMEVGNAPVAVQASVPDSLISCNSLSERKGVAVIDALDAPLYAAVGVSADARTDPRALVTVARSRILHFAPGESISLVLATDVPNLPPLAEVGRLDAGRDGG